MVMLSIVGGEYYCLPDFADVASPLDGERIDIGDEAAAAELTRAGLIQATDELRRISSWRPPQPRSDALDVAPEIATWADWLQLGQAYKAVALHYYGRSFGHTVEFARRSKLKAPDMDAELLIPRATTFAQLAPWVPSQGACLFRSFMLLAFLRAAGLDATWVFGVRTWPFQAHCWLQAGEVVLDDAVERVSSFTPILTV
ncbi:MAG: lasso peptide biosynthesis B2 protein [Pseudomonadota bacterium]|jgi:hypothetical protein